MWENTLVQITFTKEEYKYVFIIRRKLMKNFWKNDSEDWNKKSIFQVMDNLILYFEYEIFNFRWVCIILSVCKIKLFIT